MGPTFCYTMYIMKKGDIMKKLKKLGMLDADFLQGLSVFMIALILGGVS